MMEQHTGGKQKYYTNSNQKYKNKSEIKFEEASLELGYSDIDNVWRTDD